MPRIIFHIVEDKISPTKSLGVKLGFCEKKLIDLKKAFLIDDKYFGKLKDKLKTHIIITTDNHYIEFLITLYYGVNHITIFKSNTIGICLEIINMIFNSSGNFLNKFDFENGLYVVDYDTIGNSFRRRFLVVNFPINIKLNINKLKMEEQKSYKISLLPKDIIVQENQEPNQLFKKEIKDIKEMKRINCEIDKIVNKGDFNKTKNMISQLSPFDEYFNQDLMNKSEIKWNADELECYFYYFKFKLFLLKCCDDNVFEKIEYYSSAIKIFSDIYEQLKSIPDVSNYEKICAITSLYRRLKGDCDNKENRVHAIGNYKLVYMNEKNKNKCYNLVYRFISNIIENLKEYSFIFLPILQANSGFSKDVNSKDKKDIFELSMINENMIKNHLKSLLPKIIFIIRHPIIKLKRGST